MMNYVYAWTYDHVTHNHQKISRWSTFTAKTKKAYGDQKFKR